MTQGQLLKCQKSLKTERKKQVKDLDSLSAITVNISNLWDEMKKSNGFDQDKKQFLKDKLQENKGEPEVVNIRDAQGETTE